LICITPIGVQYLYNSYSLQPKYDFAVKNNITIISAEWFNICARTCSLQDTTPFLLSSKRKLPSSSDKCPKKQKILFSSQVCQLLIFDFTLFQEVSQGKFLEELNFPRNSLFTGYTFLLLDENETIKTALQHFGGRIADKNEEGCITISCKPVQVSILIFFSFFIPSLPLLYFGYETAFLQTKF
jgi:hypothetical protein